MWEDCSHRIEAHNILLHMAGELEENTKAVKYHMDLEDYENTIEALYKLFQSLIDNLSQFPKSPPNHPNTNTLDKKMWFFRFDKINYMVERINLLKKKLSDKCLLDTKLLHQMMAEIEDCLAEFKGICFEVVFPIKAISTRVLFTPL